MNLWAAIHLLAAGSALVVVALALTEGEMSPLRLPLVLLAANQFAWNGASVGTTLTGLDTFAWLGAATSPLFPPIALHFVLAFLGRRRQLKWLLVGTYVVFGLLSALTVVERLVPGEQVPGGLKTFAMMLLVLALPLAVFAVALCGRHLALTSSPVEKLRTRILLVSLVVVVSMLATEPLADLGYPVPRLATLGSFTFNGILSHLTLGLGLFKSSRPARVAVGQALLLGLFIAVSYLVIFNTLSAQTTVLITSMTALTLLITVTGWLFIKSTQSTRAGLERFASLGRFSAQMAHDLKNPLAAAKGAAEYLVEEMRRAGGGPNQEFATMVVGQLDRLHAVIDRYQRLSKLEPQLAPLDVNQLVTKVLSLQRFATGQTVSIITELATPPPPLKADADLVASALENLVKNAFEAMPQGGTLTVRTLLTEDDEPRLKLQVSDTGTGLDARAMEQAFELFFTTKATGSGLGLAFVRQVARAHGGDAELQSTEGKGTTVSILLPLKSAA